MPRKMNFHHINAKRIRRWIMCVGREGDNYKCIVVSHVVSNWRLKRRVCLYETCDLLVKLITTMGRLTMYGFPVSVVATFAVRGSTPRLCNIMHLRNRPIRDPSSAV